MQHRQIALNPSGHSRLRSRIGNSGIFGVCGIFGIFDIFGIFGIFSSDDL